jgi:hypothetical protein
MAADATLVNASSKADMANVPLARPMGEKSNVGLAVDFSSSFLEAFKQKNLETQEKNKANNDILDGQMEQFTKTADATNRLLSTYEKGGKEGAMHKQIYNNTYDYIAGLKDEFEQYNTVGDDDTSENKKKRMEVLGRLDSVKNSVVQLRADVLSVGKLAGSDGGNQMSKYAMGGGNIAVLNEIINMDGDYSNVNQRWDSEKNDMYFDVTIPDEIFNGLSTEEQELGNVRTWSARDIKDKFKLIPQGKLDEFLTGSTSAIEAGKKWKEGDKPFDLNSDISNNKKIIGNDKGIAAHIFQSTQHGSPPEGYATSKRGDMSSGQTIRDDQGNPMSPADGTSKKWEPGSWANALEANADLNGTYKVDSNDPNSKTYNYNVSTDSQEEVVDDLIKSGKMELSDVDTGGGENGDPDGIISPAEYEAVMSDMVNRDKVIDVLVNPTNPLYDHELSVLEYAKFRAKQNEGLFLNNQEGEKTDYLQLTRKVNYEEAQRKAELAKKDIINITEGFPKVAEAVDGDYYRNPKTKKVMQVVGGEYVERPDFETTVKSRI